MEDWRKWKETKTPGAEEAEKKAKVRSTLDRLKYYARAATQHILAPRQRRGRHSAVKLHLNVLELATPRRPRLDTGHHGELHRSLRGIVRDVLDATDTRLDPAARTARNAL